MFVPRLSRPRTAGAGRHCAADQQAPAAQPAAAPTAGAAPGQPPIAERLAELDALRAQSVLTDAEYNSRRAQIISEI